MKTALKIINLLAIVLLLFSCLASYISPKVWWHLSFLGFAFPLLLIVNVIFLLFWLAIKKPFGFIPLLAIALSWKFIQPTFAFHFFENNEEAGIKIMTWNVKNFDLYNWSHNKETRKKMMDLISQEAPDVLCLQEFYTDNNKIFDNVNYLRDSLGYQFFYFQPTTLLKLKPKNKIHKILWNKESIVQQWGVAIFSKFEISDTGRIDFDNSKNNDCIYVDLNVKGKPLRVYSAHFQSLHLGYDDYNTIGELEEKKTTSWGSFRPILQKMKWAYVKRASQTEAVSESIEKYRGKKILAGDFNDLPVSYTYNSVINTMQDAFVKKGYGFGSTFVNKLSIFRIDYALFDSEIKINSYRTIRKEFSDHYPLVVTFSL